MALRKLPSTLRPMQIKKPSKPEYVYHNGRMVPRSVLENEKLFSDDVKNK